jgi:hypothetical protein
MNLDRGDALDDKHQQDKPLSNKQQKDRGLHDEAHDNTREQGNRPHEDTPTLPPPPTSSLTITSSLVLPFCLILPSSLTLPLSLAAAVSVDIEDRNLVWRGYLSAPPMNPPSRRPPRHHPRHALPRRPRPRPRWRYLRLDLKQREVGVRLR